MIVKCRTKETMMMGEKLRVMTQAPYFDDGANLPNGLYVCRTYTELKDGSRNVNVVVRNWTSCPISMSGGRIIGRVVAANLVPEAEISAELMKEVSKDDEEVPKLSTQERQKLLMEVLAEKNGLQMLDTWKKENAEKARELLMEYHSVFSLEKNEMGCTDTTEHVIELTKSEPFKERFRRIAPPLMEEVRQHLQEMLDGGAIRPSNSPWCNAVVLVRKKDGTLRFCIDFWRLNDRTKKDAHPMPRMPEIMESMVGAKIFSCMDLKSGFWQVKMAEESRQYTAFTVGSLGVCEFLRMPFSLCNAPATFQRLMQNCLGELNLTYALVYLDDVVVFSDTEEEHLLRLRAVLDRFREHGLKLKPSKCHFFKTEISYLGHQVSAAGMKPGNENVQGIAEMAPPKTFTEIRRYLGATGFYRRFIKGYANIARPLQDLISEDGSKLKKGRSSVDSRSFGSLQQTKTKMHDSSSTCIRRLQQTILVGD